MRITRKLAGDCTDGTCPAVYATDDPHVVAVQGTSLADTTALAAAGGDLPAHESVVLVPRSVLETGLKGG
jgi:hypothetical protein